MVDEDSDVDVRLVEAVSRGDAAALAELYERHAGALHALFRLLLGEDAEAEDAVHDLFIEVWRCAADYDPARGRVRSWLVVRARSRALDRLKAPRHARRVQVAVESVVDRLGSSEGGSERRLEEQALHAAVLELSEEHQRVLLLGYFEGLSSSEIAERDGLPIGTVKSRVAAALSRLRERLGGKT